MSLIRLILQSSNHFGRVRVLIWIWIEDDDIIYIGLLLVESYIHTFFAFFHGFKVFSMDSLCFGV